MKYCSPLTLSFDRLSFAPFFAWVLFLAFFFANIATASPHIALESQKLEHELNARAHNRLTDRLSPTKHSAAYAWQSFDVSENEGGFKKVARYRETLSQRSPSPRDPFEPFNRLIFANTMFLGKYFFTPIYRIYETLVPTPVKMGLANAGSNIAEPLSALNGIAQVRYDITARSAMRFVTNSTLGIFGLFDVAGALGLEENQTSLSDTLGTYIPYTGPYIFLIGPSNMRDMIGENMLSDSMEDAIEAALNDEVMPYAYDPYTSYQTILSIVGIGGLTNMVSGAPAGIDLYAIVRDGYLSSLGGQNATPQNDSFVDDLD